MQDQLTLSPLQSAKPSVKTLDEAWAAHLWNLLINGRLSEPRGLKTLELPQATVDFNMMWPVVTFKERKLHIPFLGGEAYWILSGDDTVAGIAPYNRHIAKFSDDGERFFGAYGPKVVGQLDYVVDKLRDDPQSRQAGLTIWRENPPETKDVPCTVAMFFTIREGKLNTHVFMRSSDAWLGLPYDAFNFTMVTCVILKRLNVEIFDGFYLEPGTQYLTMANSHIYMEHWAKAQEIVAKRGSRMSWAMPKWMFEPAKDSSTALLTILDDLRNSEPGDAVRWWEGPLENDYIYPAEDDQ